MSAAITPIFEEEVKQELRKPLTIVPKAEPIKTWRDVELNPLLVVSAAVVFALVGATALVATILTVLALRGSGVMAP
jgi:hypothetical protein